MATSSHSSASFTAYGELCETLARPFFSSFYICIGRGKKIKKKKKKKKNKPRPFTRPVII